MAIFAAQDPWVLPDPVLVPVSEGGRFLPIIGRIERFSGRWQKLKAQSPERIEELRMVAMIQSVASSARIEGAQLTDEQVRDVLDGVQIDRFSSRDEQEVRGYRDLLQLIREEHETLRVTESALKEFHRILLQYSEKDAWHRGDYKQTPNHVERVGGEGLPVVVFWTADPAVTRWWMERLVGELEGAWDSPEWHRLMLIADFILWLLAIHPFQDGNGRLARALTTLLLLKAGYEYAPFASLERVIEDRKVNYYIALRESQAAAPRDAQNYGQWLDFFLSALEAQQQVLESRLARAAERQPLPAPQGAILDLIAERGPLTTPEIAATLRIPPRTVRYHLAQLTHQKLLDASARTAGRRYSLPLSAEAMPSGLAAAGSIAFSGSAELGGEKPAVLTPLDFVPGLQNQLMVSPNGRAYASISVVGTSIPSREPLGDRELDALEKFVRTVAPMAEPVRATPDVGWWRIGDPPRMDKFQIWMYPGPLLQAHWALDASDAPDDGNIALDPIGLVEYWRHFLRNASRLAHELDFGQCVVRLNLQTLPSNRPYIVDMDFGRLPTPTRSGTLENAPPWAASQMPVDADGIANDTQLHRALDQLLRSYSYRHTDATVDAAFALATDAWDPEVVPTRLLGRRGTMQQPTSVG
jgi:Fic family protein